MPPLPSVPNVVKAVISTLKSDATVENIIHIGYSGSPPSAGSLSSFMTAVFNPSTQTLFNAECSTDVTGVQVEMTDLSSPTGASASEPLTIAGVRTGDFAPASASVVTSWTINRRYRGGHPRTYWPFGTAGTYESGSSRFWDTGFITAVNAAIQVWYDTWGLYTISGTEFTELCQVSYVDKNLNPTPPYRRTTPVVDAIVGQVTKQRICSQRRRLGKILG